MDLSSLFGGLQTRDANSPSLEEQWSAALKRPDFQAGLLNFGVELMKPKWGGGAAALPDALSAGARGYAGVNEEEAGQAEKDKILAARQSDSAADRANRLETARIGADSRMEVQAARNAGMMERETYRRALTSNTKTPEEQKAWDKIYREAYNDIMLAGQPDEKKKQLAQERADAMLIARRARFGDAGAGPITSQNPATPTAPVGTAGPGGAPKNTSTNPQNALPTAAEAISKLQAAGRWPLKPAEIEWLKSRVRDPEVLTPATKPVVPGSTMDGF